MQSAPEGNREFVGMRKHGDLDHTGMVTRAVHVGMAMLVLSGTGVETAAAAQVAPANTTPEMRIAPVTPPGASCPTWDGNMGESGYGDPVIAVPTDDQVRIDMLAIHKKARAAVNVEEMTWDPALAAQAKAYAESLIRNQGSNLIHDPNRNGIGENLAGGKDATRFSPTKFANMWLREGQWYRAGPSGKDRCSDEATVGHYTQMIWRNSLRLGCGYAAIGDSRILACRYGPGGNITGQRAYPAGEASTWQNLYALQFEDGQKALQCKAKVKAGDTQDAVLEALNCSRRLAGVTPPLAWNTALATQAQTAAGARNAMSEPWRYQVAPGATEAWGSSLNQPTVIHPAWVVYGNINNGGTDFTAAAAPTSTKVGCGWSEGQAAQDGKTWERRILVCRFS